MIYNTIEYDRNELRLDSPVGLLKSIFQQFEERKKAIVSRTKESLDVLKLYNFYSKDFSNIDNLKIDKSLSQIVVEN